MRLHRLEIEGFGPFSERVEVDVDAVAAHGLFLLHGQTGAGKTSLLDAVCFALYNKVPGERGAAARLVSDHNGPSTHPQVVVEFTASGRRFEVTRSPAWERPKTRGTGTTRQQAAVLVREFVAGAWVPRASRLDEAGDLLAGVLGMGAEQFTKVVLLPQGDFAAFLRAKPDERRDLLEKLFGTARFTDVENWLSEQRSQCRATVEQVEGRRNDLLSRLDQIARGLPGYDPAGLAELTTLPEGQVDAAAVQLTQSWRRRAEAELTTSRATLAGATEAEQQARAGEAKAAATVAAAARLVDLTERHVQLIAQTGDHEAEVARLHAAERAERLRSRLETAREAETAATRAGAALETARGAVVELPVLAPTPQTAPSAPDDELPGQLTFDFVAPLRPAAVDADLTEADDAAIETEIDERRRVIAVLDGLAEVEQSLHEREASLTREQGLLHGHQQAVDSATGVIAELEQQLQQAREQHERLAGVAATVDDRRATLQACLDRAAAAARVAKLTPKLAETGTRASAAREANLQAREQYLQLFERRLNGMAAELAAGLADDEACPVCGSAEHPAPMTNEQTPVAAADLAAAKQQSEQAQRVADQIGAELAELQLQQAAAATASAGLTPQQAEQARQVAASAATEAEQAITALAGVEATVNKCVTELAATRDARAQRQAAASACSATITATGAAVTEQRAQLTQARAEFATLGERRTVLLTEIHALQRLLEARQAELTARQALQRAHQQSENACQAEGFDSTVAAASALLPALTRTALAERIEAVARERAELSTLLREEATAQAARSAGLDVAGQWPATEPAADNLSDSSSADGAGDAGGAVTLVRRYLAECRASQQSARHLLEESSQALAEAIAAPQRLSAAVESLTELAERLAMVSRELTPLRERYAVLDELTNTAHGRSASNTRKLRLSAYVLEARLEQVAAAASERLDLISGGRYTLVHNPERTGQGRSGLGLKVLDAWTSHERDTASLSGGETFLASLALALGLADTVQAESGGVSMETLFIDEGFGTLDEDTLELVMQCLDQLREGGRAVGVVSHVPELRTRIPAQLHVLKGRTGSQVRLIEAVA